MAKKAAYMGMFTALAFVFSYLEFLIPINLGIPGVKLGLANLVTIVALYTMGIKEACTLSLARIVLNSFTFGNPAAMLYSLAGGFLSLLAMAAAQKIKLFSVQASVFWEECFIIWDKSWRRLLWWKMQNYCTIFLFWFCPEPLQGQ